MLQAWHYLKDVDNIGISDDFRDLYYLVDYIVYSVSNTYPNFPCKSQCSECCHTFVNITSIEWQTIHKYITTVLTPQEQTQIINRNEDLNRDQIQLLMDFQLQDTIQKDLFKNFICPLLHNDLCSIYHMRPPICRAYGYFSLRAGENIKVLSCDSGADQFVAELIKSDVKEIALPAWNKFRDKINELNEPYNVLATLPLWIFTHVKDGRFIKEANLSPNFSQLIG